MVAVDARRCPAIPRPGSSREHLRRFGATFAGLVHHNLAGCDSTPVKPGGAEFRPQPEQMENKVRIAHQRLDMKRTPNDFRMDPRAKGFAGAKVNLLLFAAALALAGGVAWHFRSVRRQPAAESLPPADPIALSGSTLAVLQHLETPVEIRFYSILDPAGVPASLVSYAGRVDQLLSGFQRQGNGKINVIRYNSISDSAAQSASSDGIQPFNIDKGNACYLGLTVASGDKREPLPGLAPEWEQALEFDLSRAIERVSRPNPQPKPSAEASMIAAAAAQEVQQAIPNLSVVSLEEGTQLLRDAAMKQYKAAVDDMGAQVRQAEQQILQARQGGSEADQAAAMKHLQQVQFDQAEKLKQIAASLDARLAALRQLKAK